MMCFSPRLIYVNQSSKTFFSSGTWQTIGYQIIMHEHKQIVKQELPKINSTDLSSRNRRRYATVIHTGSLNQHEVKGGVRKTIGFKGIWKMHNYKIIPLTVLLNHFDIILNKTRIFYWERTDHWSENKWLTTLQKSDNQWRTIVFNKDTCNKKKSKQQNN
jgi:hypothetical protein